MTTAEQRDFLFEIGTEELPPKALHHLSTALGENIERLLLAAHLQHGKITLFATPRRLAILIDNLEGKQQDQEIECRGPSVNVAFTANGHPTPALHGFAKSHNIKIEDIGRATDSKGTYVTVKKVKVGEKTQALLPEIINKALKNLPIPRQMRWGKESTTFVRPVHWILMLYGSEIVNGTVLGLVANNISYGHRFHHPNEIVITSPNQYEKLLELQGYVIASFQTRKTLIAKQTTRQVGSLGTALIDDALLEEITSITEWPIALLGYFDQRFLLLPPEVLILTLQKQQRCFPVVDKTGALQASFVAISNIDSKQPHVVLRGNENVILARLIDAEFFYKNDLNYLLDSYFDQLRHTVFQTGLGNLYDKTRRLAQLASDIAEQINADVAATKRAAELSKSDLMTTMVGEFPELQGIIGSYYAQHGKEPLAVVNALREQYLPTFAKDKLPATMEGCALSIADRIDNIVGIFSLGKAPTGAGDPFGLRRAAFAILRITLEKKLPLDIFDLVRRSLQQYLKQIDRFDDVLLKNHAVSSKEHDETLEGVANKVAHKIMDFFLERQRSWYLEIGISNNVFDAVRMCQPTVTRPMDFDQRIYAVEYFRSLDEAQTLCAAHKRVKNILADVASINPSKKVSGNGSGQGHHHNLKTAATTTAISDTIDQGLYNKSTAALEADYEKVEIEAKEMLRSLKTKLRDIQLVAKDFIKHSDQSPRKHLIKTSVKPSALFTELTLVAECESEKEQEEQEELDQTLLRENAEKNLAVELSHTTTIITSLCSEAKYQEALKEMAALKNSIDCFFNTVMVMVEDERIRHNRLLLLKQLQTLFCSVADLSYLMN